MGCASARYIDIYHTNSKIAEWKPYFDVLCLNEADVGKFYSIFRKVDVDGSGNIELAELLVHLDLDRTPFTKRVFSIFDEDGSGEIDFREFVLSLWNYCTLGKATLVLFAFDLYDRDSSGAISCTEVQHMLRDVYGPKQAERNQHARAIFNKLQEMEESIGDIDVEVFKSFVKTYPALLFPAFNMQDKIQSVALGHEFWKYHSEKRMELSKGRFIAISEFMEIHLNKKSKENLLFQAEIGAVGVTNRAVKLLGTTGTYADRAGGGAVQSTAKTGKRPQTLAAQDSLTITDVSDNSSSSIEPAQETVGTLSRKKSLKAATTSIMNANRLKSKNAKVEPVHEDTADAVSNNAYVSKVVNPEYSHAEASATAMKFVTDSLSVHKEALQMNAPSKPSNATQAVSNPPNRTGARRASVV